MMTFSYFSGIGKISTIISLLYMYLLAIVGTLMLVEVLRELEKKKKLKKNYMNIIGFKVYHLE